MKSKSGKSDTSDLFYERLNKSIAPEKKRLIGELWLKSLLYPGFNRVYLRIFILALLAGIAYADFLTGDYIVLFPFYALAIMIMGLYDGLAGAFVTVIIVSVLEIVSDFALHGQIRIIDDINQLFRTALWLIIAYGASSMRSYVLTILHQQSNLNHALEKLKLDMESAQMVQNALIAKKIPHDPRIDSAAYYSMAQELGGDFYCIDRDGDKLTLCIADVSGKGPPAALVTALLCGLLEESRNRIESPSALLSLINERVYSYIADEFFITCFYGIVDLAGKKLTYASAGHDPPLLLRKLSGKVEELSSTGLPLGVSSTLVLQENEIPLQEQDILVLYTDGLPNFKKPDGTRIGVEAMITDLEAYTGGSAGDISSSLLSLASENNATHSEDDIVLIVVRLKFQSE